MQDTLNTFPDNGHENGVPMGANLLYFSGTGACTFYYLMVCLRPRCVLVVCGKKIEKREDERDA